MCGVEEGGSGAGRPKMDGNTCKEHLLLSFLESEEVYHMHIYGLQQSSGTTSDG